MEPYVNVAVSVLTSAGFATIAALVLKWRFDSSIEAYKVKLKTESDKEIERYKLGLKTESDKEIEEYRTKIKYAYEISQEMLKKRISFCEEISEKAYTIRNRCRDLVNDYGRISADKAKELRLLNDELQSVVFSSRLYFENTTLFDAIHAYKNYVGSFVNNIVYYEDRYIARSVDYYIEIEQNLKDRYKDIDRCYTFLKDELSTSLASTKLDV